MSAFSNTNWDRRNVLRAALGLTAAGTLAACGSNNGRGSGGGSGTNLVQMFHAYGEAGTEQAIKRYAKAYKDANVTTQWITSADFESKLFSSLLTKNAPDLFEFHPQIQMVKSGQVADLTDIIEPVKADFNPADIKSHTVDGKIYGVRMIDDPQFFFYRKSMLEKAGVDVPTTLDELMEAADKLTTGKVKGLYMGNDLHNVINPMIWSAGADTLNEKNEIAYHTDGVIEGIKKMRKLFTSGHLLLGAPTESWDPSSLNQGLCAIQFCGMWAMPQIQDALGDDWGVFPFPKTVDSGKQSVYNGGWSMFVNAKGKNVDAAKEYVKWLWIDQKEYQEDWATSYGFHIPPRISLAKEATKLKSGNAAEGVRLFNEFGHFDNIGWTQAMITALEDVFANAVRKDMDPEKALDKADVAVNRELKKLFG
ncbi:sugar ABC transporter substrate-binding protein [Streptomyces ipomoeae]|jgi:multiple sugar transport system substrate-binding protein|uniref:Tat pathway signal sequence domain protein n=2 Tax=Streptomyces ipomoeae TaxID=103232 RepID=L1L7C4_9ACTN|nr:sugar ABC transporter substrate-binding protein [Streptomyces ipomoeae]EKX68787.1 Tat pathway signal sequence domain protein [Streptomyces ipomoeae 91-03]MDX2696257.1 sugar ABC transporter substrate-binding protein [Streptomyces ipomoeae]MDX2826102.1 sugar ABC transporter substrate-binding protein [Streptomyces ipomoeae]MDX2842042.1 sugar ABC transporter substrate-binding protein [Streptomyces ipomoeae]MDX2878830.1 sugar ABC transporter substrate-binding protein [Streptomyces ipomoeae]